MDGLDKHYQGGLKMQASTSYQPNSIGLLPSISHGLIAQGPIELIHYFVSKSTRDMSAQMNEMELDK